MVVLFSTLNVHYIESFINGQSSSLYMKWIIIMLLLLLVLTVGCAQVPQHLDDEMLEDVHGEDHGNFSVDIKCEQLKNMPISEIAGLWGINPEELLDEIIVEYELKGIYTTKSTLDDLRAQNKFQPRGVKEIAERIKGPVAVGEKTIEKIITDCPFEEVNDPFPGNCAAYTDKDSDELCDYSQP